MMMMMMGVLEREAERLLLLVVVEVEVVVSFEQSTWHVGVHTLCALQRVVKYMFGDVEKVED